MKKRVPDKFWFPWWPGKWIFGSVRIEFSPAERGIWVDLLSFASMDDGHIRANEDTPYLLQQLSGMLIIPEKELEAAINKFIKNKKLTKLKSGTLYVTKWEKYQFSDRHKRRIEDSVEPQENEDEIFYKTAIRCPEAFFDMANKSGTVRVNRLIVAIILGRSLEPEEEVHHINKKENDNKPENLMLFADHEDHGKYEHGFKIEPIWDGSKLSKTAKTAIVAKIKAAIIYNSTLNNNKLNKSKIEFSFEERKFLNITIEDKSGWLAAYPACDIDIELYKMREWLLANPDKRKKNYRRFIVNWLTRTQDKGGSEKIRRKPGGAPMTRKEERDKGIDDWTKGKGEEK